MFKDIEEGSHRTLKIQRLALLIVTLADGWIGSARLGSLLHVSQKTVYRNVRALEMAGLPVEFKCDPDTKGPKGQKYRLAPYWVSRKSWATEAQKHGNVE